MSVGDFPLVDVSQLPNIARTHPGEKWSDIRARGLVEPGAPVFPSSAPAGHNLPEVHTPGTQRWYKQVAAGDVPVAAQIGLAMRPVEPPYRGEYPDGWGPNEVVNQDIAEGDYILTWFSGVFILTLLLPRIAGYPAGSILGWNPAAVRPVSKRGAAGTRTGAWELAGANTIDTTEVLEVHEWDVHNAATGEGSVEVRFLGRTSTV